MIQIANLEELTSADIPKLIQLVEPVLTKRKRLHEKYSRNATASKLMFTSNNDKTVIPFEKFITDLATGYTSGSPRYTVKNVDSDDKSKLISDLLDKQVKDVNYKESMEILINYIRGYNDDYTENYDLIHDLLEFGACYEITYENQNNEIVYSKYDAMQTVATWDYSIPANLTGLIRLWTEKDINGTLVKKVELTDKNGSRKYTQSKQEVTEDEVNNHNWGDVPAIAVETDFSIFEPCEDVIQAYEQLIQNTRNTYQYNDSNCKLKFTGYVPENEMIIYDKDNNPIINPARQLEDDAWYKAKNIYVAEGGNVEWMTKPLETNGVVTILKTYVDLMFQIAGIPNTSDLAFNSADLNASAIDRKFYVMNMATNSIVSQLKKAYQRRWELIFGRINLKKGTQFDFRDIDIEIPKNLPANNDELVDSVLKMQDILSEQTIIEKLGYNYQDEKAKKEEESSENIMANIERIKLIGGNQEDESDSEDEISRI